MATLLVLEKGPNTDDGAECLSRIIGSRSSRVWPGGSTRRAVPCRAVRGTVLFLRRARARALGTLPLDSFFSSQKNTSCNPSYSLFERAPPEAKTLSAGGLGVFCRPWREAAMS
jgi:hypothetical protein